MANDLNQCNFIGRLGKEPEMRFMTNGDPIASFSIAVGSVWTDKSSGEKKESTEWINVTAFRGLAKVCGDYLHKGSKVFISGQMKTEKYTDKATGADRYTTKIIANEMQILDGKGGESSPQRSSENRGAPAEQKDEFDPFDDIPF